MRYAGLGVQLAVSLLVFVLVGQWADRKLGTGGIITVAGRVPGVRRHDVLADPPAQPEGRRRRVSAGPPLPGRAWRWWRPARWRLAALVPGAPGRAALVGRRRRAGAAGAARLVGTLRAIGTDRFMAGLGTRHAGPARAWSWSPAADPAAGARPSAPADAGGDGGGPRGAPRWSRESRRCGNTRGKTSDDAIRPGVRGAGRCCSAWRAAVARWRRRSMRSGARRASEPDRHHRTTSRTPTRSRLPFGGRGSCRAGSRSTSAGSTIDFSPTKHLVYMLLAAALVALVFLLSARSIARAQAAGTAGQGLRRRDGGHGALHPAGGHPAERGPPRRGLRSLPADPLLLHPGDEPPRACCPGAPPRPATSR